MRTPRRHAKLGSDSLQSYWSDLSERHLSNDDDGLSAICYAGMPLWFNRFLDVYQRKAMARLLQDEDLSGVQVLDVGTGVGRWARWFAASHRAEVTGIDIEPARLAQAERMGGNVTYLEMAADDLAFPAESFDLISSVTVLQHVEDDTKRGAIAEFMRVLRPGGRVVLLEISQSYDDAAHVFPWSKRTWEAEFAKCGFELKGTVGDHYAPLLRMLKTGFSLWKGESSRAEIGAMKDEGGDGHKIMMSVLRLAVLASYPIEEVARFLPSEFAKITGFLYVKK